MHKGFIVPQQKKMVPNGQECELRGFVPWSESSKERYRGKGFVLLRETERIRREWSRLNSSYAGKFTIVAG